MKATDIKHNLARALEILKEEGVEWVLQALVHSAVSETDSITIDKTKHSIDFPDCYKVRRFRFEENFYEVFLLNDHRVVEKKTLDATVTKGQYRLDVNGETVFLGEYEGRDDTPRTIQFTQPSIKILRLGDWVTDLPRMMKNYHQYFAEIYKKERWEEEEKDLMTKDVDLGKFE